MSLPEYGVQNYNTRTVWYNGTAVTRQGQPLFYLDDAATGIKLPNATQADASFYPKNVRIGNVVDGINATGAHLSAFAGIVADSHVGIAGPKYIDIICPVHGDVLQIEVENFAAITKNVSFLVPQTANSDADAYETKATPVAADGSVFLALETVAVNAGTPGTSDARSVIWGLCIR